MAAQDLEVRPARVGDLAALVELYGQLADEPPAAPSDALRIALEDMIAVPFVQLLVAELRGAVVGTAELVVVPNVTHEGRPWAQLENMVVDREARGLGIGQALLQRCADIARGLHCYKIQLQSANHREAAHRFYETFGFAPSSRGYRLYFP